MKTAFVSFIVALAALPMAYAQSPDTLWTRTYGGTGTEEAFAIQQTSDGGYIMVGHTQPHLNWVDIYLVKTNSNGDWQWGRVYGGLNTEYARDVKQTSDGGYIITGHTESWGAGDYDIFLVKTDSMGDTLWTRTYGHTGEDMACSVHQTPDGGYIVAGHTYSIITEYDIYVVKTDSGGDTLWTRTYGGDDYEQAWCLEPTTDGGYVIAGYTETYGPGYYNWYLVKIDSLGNMLWDHTYGEYEPGGAYSVRQTRDQGFILAGYIIGPCMTSDIFLVKTDDSGDTLWTCFVWDDMSDETAYDVQETVQGEYIVAGIKANWYNEDDLYLLKISGSGELLWSNTYGGVLDDGARAVQQTPDGGYLIVGQTYSFGAGAGDFYLVKTEPDEPPAVPPGQSSMIPETLVLYPCYPNPFNPLTSIPFELPVMAKVSLKVYNILGQQVGVVIDGEVMEAGQHTVRFDGGDLASGIYFYQLRAGEYVEVRKMVLMK